MQSTFMRPGKSTNVRLSIWGEKILRLIGKRLMPLFWPAILAVSASISCLTWSKSEYRRPGMWRNSAHSWVLATALCPWGAYDEDKLSVSTASLGVLISWRIRGRRVTIPDPRGKKSRPTRLLDCNPCEWLANVLKYWTFSAWLTPNDHNLG